MFGAGKNSMGSGGGRVDRGEGVLWPWVLAVPAESMSEAITPMVGWAKGSGPAVGGVDRRFTGRLAEAFARWKVFADRSVVERIRQRLVEVELRRRRGLGEIAGGLVEEEVALRRPPCRCDGRRAVGESRCTRMVRTTGRIGQECVDWS